MVLPFVALLLAIALGPLLFPKAWPHHYAAIVCALGAITLAYYLFGLHASARILHVAHDYAGFIALIGSLFVVSGGIHITVKGEATPAVNVLFLLLGALAANLLGTTGASMLLIRPWICVNKYRIAAHHIVFFIFIVSNIGGCLTPIGDPPLFLGYLKGIPFGWVTAHCWPMWAVAVGLLLAVFYVVDAAHYRRASAEVRARLLGAREKWRFEGLGNLGFLLVILGAVFIKQPLFLREVLLVGAAVGSWFTTRKTIHEANQFDFHPIREVAILFLGLFATMIPALDLVQAHAHRLGEASPALFYWCSGLLSSILDNAPTYMAFLSAIVGLLVEPQTGLAQIGEFDLNLLLGSDTLSQYLVAISVGAVFFGAATYVGNAPNFMVKAIADRNKVRMPGFLGFVFKYSVPYLAPVLVLIWLLFLRTR